MNRDENIINETDLWEENSRRFPPVTMEDILEVLSITIKKDDANKFIILSDSN